MPPNSRKTADMTRKKNSGAARMAKTVPNIMKEYLGLVSSFTVSRDE
jgi:hypothetical protein